jgi:hypothetical protein
MAFSTADIRNSYKAAERATGALSITGPEPGGWDREGTLRPGGGPVGSRPGSQSPAARCLPRERVVAGQRLMQAATDVFLGWIRIGGSTASPAAATSGGSTTGRACGRRQPVAAGSHPLRTGLRWDPRPRGPARSRGRPGGPACWPWCRGARDHRPSGDPVNPETPFKPRRAGRGWRLAVYITGVMDHHSSNSWAGFPS